MECIQHRGLTSATLRKDWPEEAAWVSTASAQLRTAAARSAGRSLKTPVAVAVVVEEAAEGGGYGPEVAIWISLADSAKKISSSLRTRA